jgi:hypothetical protein
MITHHFYTTDSITATFVNAFQKGDVKLASVCAKELIDSCEQDTLKTYATFVWLCDDPCYDTANRIQSFLSYDTSPTSFLETLLTDRKVQPEEEDDTHSNKPPRPYESTVRNIPWKVLPNGWTPGEANTLWKTVCDAQRHTNIDRMMYLTSYFILDNKPSLLNLLTALKAENIFIKMLEAKNDIHIQNRILKLIYASLLFTKTTIPMIHPVVKHVFSSPTTMGCMGRQIHIDKQVCAYWNIPIPSESQLKHAPLLIQNGTKFWQQIIKQYKIRFDTTNLIFQNDDELEDFYTRYFPDDIPDEWSAEERQKSHGCTTTLHASEHDTHLASLFGKFLL